MPERDPSHHYGRRWWRAMHSDDPAAAQEWAERAQRFRPAWWPENEPWPPARRHWPARMRRPFLRRMGCLFLVFSLLIAGFIVSIVLLVLNALGLTAAPLHQAPWLAPLAGVGIAVVVAAVTLAISNVRRMSAPLDDLLSASHRVAEGDYSVRVAPRGPAEVSALAAAFNSMTERLESHERLRRSMLADVTHELRTPLTIMQGNLEGMLDGLYPADEAHLRSLLEEAQILSRLTDDLRTLALAESGSLQLKREPANLVALARDTIASHQPSADAAGVRIELVTPQGEIAKDIDAERVRQVLGNLISNAVRYAPRGSVVYVRLATGGAETTVSVTDSGPGIPAEDLPHIFDRYYKSADSRGMGLGLAIARYLVEAHGGKITASSRPGQGTTMEFSLPV